VNARSSTPRIVTYHPTGNINTRWFGVQLTKTDCPSSEPKNFGQKIAPGRLQVKDEPLASAREEIMPPFPKSYNLKSLPVPGPGLRASITTGISKAVARVLDGICGLCHLSG